MGAIQTAAKKTWGYRHVILGIVWLLYLINYFDRTSVLTFLPLIREDLSLTHEQIGFAASIFFFAYAIAQVSAGYLADKFGSKRVMGIAITVFTLVTFLTGLVRDYTQFILLRLGLGLGEGHHFAPANRTIADWFPKEEKGRATGFFSTTWAVGPAIIPVIITFLAAYFGSWRPVFYVLAVPGLLGVIILWLYVSDFPEQMLKKGKLSQEEYDYIKAGLVADKGTENKKGGFAIVARDPSFWVYTLALFCSLAVYWGSTTWISSFLYEQHGFNLKTMGLLVALPYAVAFVAMMVGGWLMDKVFHRAKPVLLISFFASIPILVMVGQVSKGDVPMLLLMLVLIGFFVNLNWGVIYAYPQIRYPKDIVGSAVGLSNGIGQLGAFISPLVAGYLVVKTPAGIHYTNVFIFFAVAAALAALASLFLKENEFHLNETKSSSDLSPENERIAG